LAEAQKVLSEMLPTIKSVDGVQGVQRVVCGGCLDFKVVTTLPAEKFGAWEETGFAPEEKFLEALKKVDGLTMIETQTYTVRNSVIL
jgi:predicted TPR repeat methyltransferase